MKDSLDLLARLGPGASLSKIHELIREINVGQVMTSPVYTVSSWDTMDAVKISMREHRISGLPVVDNGELVGLVSTADLIRALEEGRLNAPVSEYMTRQLVCARTDEPVLEALRRAEKTGVGRMPVVDNEGKLQGVLTRGDIVTGLLRALQQAYSAFEQQRRPHYFFEALESDETSLILRYRVHFGDFTHGGHASAKIKQALLRIGASAKFARRVAIATYEAEINLIIHTTDGGYIVAELHPDRITVVAHDSGPGIPDVELARQPGYSTASNIAREMGFGAGMGLPNIERCADEVNIWSAVGVGTRVEMVFYVPPEEIQPM